MTALTDIELPSPPATAIRLIHLCSEPDTSISEIVEAISLDAALAASLIRTANSAFYGQQYEVATLQRATVVLGVARVKVIALGFQLAEMSKKWHDVPIDLRRVWQGNVLRACLARQLAAHGRDATGRHLGESFLVGLLQDFAVPIVATATGEAYAAALGAEGLFTHDRIIPFEEEAAGCNHAHVAGRLFDTWRFPPLLTFAITNHHVAPPDTPAKDTAMALWQMAYWVGAVPFSEDQQTAPVGWGLRNLALRAFGLDASSLSDVFYQAIEEYESLRRLFDGLLPPGIDGASIMEHARELTLQQEPPDGQEPPNGFHPGRDPTLP